MIPPPTEVGTEELLVNAVLWLKLGVEAVGALVIGLGVIASLYQFARSSFPPSVDSYLRKRLTLARFLALGLEFQLGADILSTAVAPTWETIGKLGAIAVIRTALNYFLSREMREEHHVEQQDQRESPA